MRKNIKILFKWIIYLIIYWIIYHNWNSLILNKPKNNNIKKIFKDVDYYISIHKRIY